MYAGQEWKAVARQIDHVRGLSDCKSDDASPFYNYKLIRRQLRAMRKARADKDAGALMQVVRECMHSNYAGICNERLYQDTFEGTKWLIDEFVAECRTSLEYIAKAAAVPAEEKREYFSELKKTFGETVLCLSGGGAMGHYHLGVVRTLLDENVLPRIIHGTSAGAIIGAIVCTRTDDGMLLGRERGLCGGQGADLVMHWLRRAARDAYAGRLRVHEPVRHPVQGAHCQSVECMYRSQPLTIQPVQAVTNIDTTLARSMGRCTRTPTSTSSSPGTPWATQPSARRICAPAASLILR